MNPTPSNASVRWPALLVAAVTLLAFVPAVLNDFVDWDDVTFVVGNPRFNPPTLDTLRFYWTHAGRNLYIPLTYTLWAALAKIAYVPTPDAMGARLNPYVFHLASVLLHVVTTLAVFGIVRQAVGRTWPAVAGALLFALHPLQVMAVAFVGATNTPLAAALALSAVWLYLRSGAGPGARRWRTPGFWLATMLFSAALLAKPTAVVAPVLALILDLLAKRRSLRVALLSIVPWVVLVIPCVVWTRMIQTGSVAVARPLWTRPLVVGDAVAFYAGKVIAPRQLAIDYGRTPEAVLTSPLAWVTWTVPALMIAVALLLRRRSPVAAGGIVIFLVALLPNSGLVPFDYQHFSTTCDHYLYLSMLGVAMLTAVALAQVPRPVVAVTISVLVLIGCLIATERQIGTWRDGERLFRHAIAVNPGSWMSRNNLATVVMDRSPDEAIALCTAAVRAKPDYAFAFNNIGSALMLKGEPAAAVNAFARAYQLAPQGIVFAGNYARALAINGRNDEAAAVYQQMLARDPSNATARSGLAGLSLPTTPPEVPAR